MAVGLCRHRTFSTSRGVTSRLCDKSSAFFVRRWQRYATGGRVLPNRDVGDPFEVVSTKEHRGYPTLIVAMFSHRISGVTTGMRTTVREIASNRRYESLRMEEVDCKARR